MPCCSDFVFHFCHSNKLIIFDFYRGNIDFIYRHSSEYFLALPNNIMNKNKIKKIYD